MMLEFMSLLWAGEIVGISFLATPIKFQATQYGATMPMLLSVGKVTFNLQNIIDMVMAVVLIIALSWRHTWGEAIPMWGMGAYLGVLVIVLIQSFYLLPILDIRTEAYINGTPMPPSYHHIIYAILEAVKVILLLIYPIKSLLFG